MASKVATSAADHADRPRDRRGRGAIWELVSLLWAARSLFWQPEQANGSLAKPERRFAHALRAWLDSDPLPTDIPLGDIVDDVISRLRIIIVVTILIASTIWLVLETRDWRLLALLVATLGWHALKIRWRRARPNKEGWRYYSGEAQIVVSMVEIVALALVIWWLAWVHLVLVVEIVLLFIWPLHRLGQQLLLGAERDARRNALWCVAGITVVTVAVVSAIALMALVGGTPPPLKQWSSPFEQLSTWIATIARTVTILAWLFLIGIMFAYLMIAYLSSFHPRLQRIRHDLSAVSDKQEETHQLLEQVRQLAGADIVTFHPWNAHEEVLERPLIVVGPEEVLREPTWMRQRPSRASRAWEYWEIGQHGRPQFWDNVGPLWSALRVNRPSFVSREGIRSSACCVINGYSGSEIARGLLWINYREERLFDETRKAWIGELCRTVAEELPLIQHRAMERRRLLDERLGAEDQLRRRLTNLVHEAVTQGVTAAKRDVEASQLILADQVLPSLDVPARRLVRTQLDTIAGKLEYALGELRTLRTMRDRPYPRDLPALLCALKRCWQESPFDHPERARDLDASGWTLKAEPWPLPYAALYEVLAEAVLNASKHCRTSLPQLTASFEQSLGGSADPEADDESELVLAVIDHGIGIDEPNRMRLDRRLNHWADSAMMRVEVCTDPDYGVKVICRLSRPQRQSRAR